jgi:hypothetical protein
MPLPIEVRNGRTTPPLGCKEKRHWPARRYAVGNGGLKNLSRCRGRQLVTLEDAGKHITKLPKAEHEAAEWQAAMEALILVATSGGPTMFARIGIMRALNRGHVREFNPDRTDHHWGRRKLARDRGPARDDRAWPEIKMPRLDWIDQGVGQVPDGARREIASMALRKASSSGSYHLVGGGQPEI